MSKHDLISKTLNGDEIRVYLSQFLKTQETEDVDIFMSQFGDKYELKSLLLDYKLIDETNTDTFFLRHYFGSDKPRNKTIIYGDKNLEKYAKELKQQKKANLPYVKRLITPDDNFNKVKKSYEENIQKHYEYFIDHTLFPRGMTRNMIMEYIELTQKDFLTSAEKQIVVDREQSFEYHLRKYDNYRKYIVCLRRDIQKKNEESSQIKLELVEAVPILKSTEVKPILVRPKDQEFYDREDIDYIKELQKEEKPTIIPKVKSKKPQTPGQIDLRTYYNNLMKEKE